tara:strand:+ start:7229 stop:8581 length:1353 start_codon:yes stop_codon:yes gene_type:complete
MKKINENIIKKSKYTLKRKTKLKNRTINSQPIVLILDIGTFCDHRLMDTAITHIRPNHKIVYITSPTHKLPSTDIRIDYSIPDVIIEKPGIIATNLSTNSVKFSLENPKTTVKAIESHVFIKNLLINTIKKYSPIRVLAHCGNISHILASECYKDIPTSIIYFAPGFLPNEDIPFIFHTELSNYKIDLYKTETKQFNIESCEAFHKQIARTILPKKIIDRMFKSSNLKHLEQIRHIMCFKEPLVPKLKYAISNLSIKNVGPLKANLSNAKLEDDLEGWIKTHKKFIFISFGSYTSKIINSFPGFFGMIEEACKINKIYALIHDNDPKYNFSKDYKSPYLFFYSKFIPYPSIVKKCKLVCFTGSVCLQNVSWMNKCPMLYFPYLPEQYFWAKLYRMHTHVDFIDYKNEAEISLFSHKLYNALNVDNIQFFQNIKHSFSDKAPVLIANEVLR